MPGANLPPLDDEALRAVLANPIGAPRLRNLARERKEAVIIFDDISRPTPVHRLWPFVVEELHAGGIDDDHIRMICALGTHGAHSREDFRRKVGEEALRRFPVYNHNPYQHCTLVGSTSQGTPIEVNNEVLACDLRIGIGSVLPHPGMGFGGGPKIILPGVVSFNTIQTHHGPTMQRLAQEGHGPTFRAGFAENAAWKDIAEAAALAGLDFIVNSILNQRREVVGLVAGHFVEAWRQGVALARPVYGTLPPDGADVVITNGYAKGNEAMISTYANGIGRGSPDGGRDLVTISNCPQGVVVHYLSGDFGPHARNAQGPLTRGLPQGVRHMVVLNPFPEKASRTFFDALGDQEYVTTWDEVLQRLAKWHPDGARVIVYPDLTMQYLLMDAVS
jgi:nickel-dependent lactate racemase